MRYIRTLLTLITGAIKCIAFGIGLFAAVCAISIVCIFASVLLGIITIYGYTAMFDALDLVNKLG